MTKIFDEAAKFQPGDFVVTTKDLETVTGSVYKKGSKLEVAEITYSGSDHSTYNLKDKSEIVIENVSDEFLINADPSTNRLTRIPVEKLDDVLKNIKDKHRNFDDYQRMLVDLKRIADVIENPTEKHHKIELTTYAPLRHGPVSVDISAKDDELVNEFRDITLRLLKRKTEQVEKIIDQYQEYFSKFMTEFSE